MVVPPFGFGVGDFLAAAKLTGKIVSELKDNGEAASKYQDLIIELESLERALRRLYTIKPSEHELTHLEAIRAAASACKRPLESFLAKIEKFEKRLGTENAKGNRLKGAGRRIQFNVAFENDIKELRTTLASHVLTINTLLMTQVLESITAAETDREKNVKSLQILHVAHETLLESIGRKQDEMSVDSSAHMDDLNKVLQEKIDLMHLEGAGASIKLDEQQQILEAIEQKIELLKTKLEIPDAPAETGTRNSVTAAMNVTSTLVSLVLSGSMLASTHALVTKAREMSMIAREMKRCVPIEKHSIQQQSASNQKAFKGAEEMIKSCSSGISDAIDANKPAMDLRSLTSESDVDEESCSSVCHSQKGRASRAQVTQPRDEPTNNQQSSSCNPSLHTQTAELSQNHPDQNSRDSIWSSSTASSEQKNPPADKQDESDIDETASKPLSNKASSSSQTYTSAQDDKSHAQTRFPPRLISGAGNCYGRGRERASKMSFSTSDRCADRSNLWQSSSSKSRRFGGSCLFQPLSSNRAHRYDA